MPMATGTFSDEACRIVPFGGNCHDIALRLYTKRISIIVFLMPTADHTTRAIVSNHKVRFHGNESDGWLI